MNSTAYVLLTSVSSISMAFAVVNPMPLSLVWNVSASVPVGLYSIEPAGSLIVTDLVAAMPPEPFAGMFIERGYLGKAAPLLKRVMGLPGQIVCRQDGAITVDAVPLGDAPTTDSMGRELPVWNGCRRVAPGQLFLMNPDVRDSLDGRYFGPISAVSVIGRAIPLYTDEAGDGRFVWRAAVR